MPLTFIYLEIQMEILSVSLVLPVAEDELGLNERGTAALSTSIFFGMLLGGVAWGLFGDSLDACPT